MKRSRTSGQRAARSRSSRRGRRTLPSWVSGLKARMRWLTGSSRRARRNRVLVTAGAALLLAGLVACCLVETASRERRWRVLAEHYAWKTGLDPALVIAVIRAESAGNADAVSRVGARGLMQLMPPTAEEMARKNGVRYRGPDDLFDPDLNVRLGTLYLAWLRRYFRDDPWLYVAAYNAGPGSVDKWRRANPELSSRQLIEKAAYAETRAYVAHVLRLWGKAPP